MDDPILDHEICGDGGDNTGDGRIDEGCPQDDMPTTPPIGNTPGVEICDDRSDNDNDGFVDEGCSGINSGLGSQFALNPATGICFACVEDDTDAGPPPQEGDEHLTGNSDPISAPVNLRSGSIVTQTSTEYGKALSDTKAVIGEGNLLAYLQQAKAESLHAIAESSQVIMVNQTGPA